MTDARLTFNGIHAATGDYLTPPMSVRELADRLAARPRGGEPLPESRGLRDESDPTDLASAGWGIVFHRDADPAVRHALEPLVRHRERQAGDRHRVFADDDGYRPGESKLDFLDRHGVGPGPVDPDRVPFYLLLVGGPLDIPYGFQHQLDVPFAVGRIAFDTPEEYARYAESVVAAETGGADAPPAARRASFVGVRNACDPATALSSEELVPPLAERLRPIAGHLGWEVETVPAEEATKERLTSLVGGTGAPGLLFTASHGMGFEPDDPRQLRQQGALLCQDWPGRGHPVSEDHYLTADDVPDDADCAGRIAFFFACYGGGTPGRDRFVQRLGPTATSERIAPHPFVARLPQRLLAHPRGGALAVVAHVDRAWTLSFHWRRAGRQLQVFEDAFRRLMGGEPAGWALQPFGDRCAELANDLASEQEKRYHGEEPDPEELVGLWTGRNDALSYTLLGDPAVRLGGDGRG